MSLRSTVTAAPSLNCTASSRILRTPSPIRREIR